MDSSGEFIHTSVSPRSKRPDPSHFERGLAIVPEIKNFILKHRAAPSFEWKDSGVLVGIAPSVEAPPRFHKSFFPPHFLQDFQNAKDVRTGGIFVLLRI